MSRLAFVGSILVSTCSLLSACGGRSELDDYSNGLPAVIPGVIVSPGDGDNGDGDGDKGDGDGDKGDGDGDKGDGDGDDGTGADVGAACAKKTDCMGGDKAECIMDIVVDTGIPGFTIPINFPGGSCAITGCTKDADCPKGSGCISGFAQPACTVVCSDATQCRAAEGYTCGAVPGSDDTRTICQPPLNLPF